ncbi:MAG: glycosyltransferase family 2 protein [Candidatus Heimdallarchaeota archaeon]
MKLVYSGDDLKVIITMAGEGRRFLEKGFTEPKFMIELNNRTIFNYSISSLKNFFDQHFIFILQKKHNAIDFVKKECEKLGIAKYDCIEIEITTDGQATTALLADSIINDDDPAMIYNIDTYVEEGEILANQMKADGCIPVFEAEGEKWSFVKLNENGIVTKVSEKVRISNLGSIGLYYFAHWKFFKDAYTALSEEVGQTYKEKYIAPLYNWMISIGMNIVISTINTDKVHILGTPEDVKKFYPKIDY